MFRPGVPRHTIEESSQLIGLDVSAVRGLWRALGFADPDPNSPAVSDDDIAAGVVDEMVGFGDLFVATPRGSVVPKGLDAVDAFTIEIAERG
jgi:hypothetical protein